LAFVAGSSMAGLGSERLKEDHFHGDIL
jgi:hypothetical protein